MTFNSTLGTGLDGTSNPDPNGLGTVAAYTASQAKTDSTPLTPSAAWTTQAKPALFPIRNIVDGVQQNIRLFVVPSSAGASITLKYWGFCALSGTWALLSSDTLSSIPAGGAVATIEAPGDDAVFVEIDSISAGTASIYFDGANARKG